MIKITSEQASKIIDDREPYGHFYFKDNQIDKFIAIDNCGGDAWTEEFDTLEQCKRYFDGENPEEIKEDDY